MNWKQELCSTSLFQQLKSAFKLLVILWEGCNFFASNQSKLHNWSLAILHRDKDELFCNDFDSYRTVIFYILITQIFTPNFWGMVTLQQPHWSLMYSNVEQMYSPMYCPCSMMQFDAVPTLPQCSADAVFSENPGLVLQQLPPYKMTRLTVMDSVKFLCRHNWRPVQSWVTKVEPSADSTASNSISYVISLQ